ESPEQCAVRELGEEVGLIARRMEKLGQFYMSPGVMNEAMHLYRATNLIKTAHEPEEGINVVRMKLGQAVDMIKTGEIVDAKTICGIFWVVWGIPQKEMY
ncbi:MAG: NUDIX hydrolase, partial [Candidatus Brocadiales bacterium]